MRSHILPTKEHARSPSPFKDYIHGSPPPLHKKSSRFPAHANQITEELHSKFPACPEITSEEDKFSSRKVFQYRMNSPLSPTPPLFIKFFRTILETPIRHDCKRRKTITTSVNNNSNNNKLHTLCVK
jgi:hypothetical protein